MELIFVTSPQPEPHDVQAGDGADQLHAPAQPSIGDWM